jgi:cytochrome c2
MKIFLKNSIYILFLLFISCGPRSGVHYEEKKEEVNMGCGTDMLGDGNFESYSPRGAKLFKQNCAVCHRANSNDRLTGPGLKGIADRLPQPADQWFINYTLNNEKVFKNGNAYAAKLKAEYGGLEMTIFEGQLEEGDVMEIYKYLTGPQVNKPIP